MALGSTLAEALSAFATCAERLLALAFHHMNNDDISLKG
jgi:hypothetical protein